MNRRTPNRPLTHHASQGTIGRFPFLLSIEHRCPPIFTLPMLDGLDPLADASCPRRLPTALDQLASEYQQAAADATFCDELNRLLRALRRPAVAALSCRAVEPTLRRGANLSETRRPQPHRVA